MLKSFFLKLVDGFIYGMGFCLFTSLFASVIAISTGVMSIHKVRGIFQQQGIIEAPARQEETTPTTVFKQFSAPRIVIPTDATYTHVSSAAELRQAISRAADTPNGDVIVLATGTYTMAGPTYIKTDNVYIRSESGNPYDTIIRWSKGNVYNKGGNLFRVDADHFYIDGITLSGARNHLIQVAGETNTSYTKVNNCILQDAYEQFLKVSYNRTKPENRSVGGEVTNSVFQYTKGIAPNYYTGGIDALGAENWIVRGNVFRDIASPEEHIAQHAIHFWVNSSGTVIENNLFIDNDRSIGLGMPLPQNQSSLVYSHNDGKIINNLIFHADNKDPYGDVGIILEASQNTLVSDNVVYMEHNYPRGIEYRFSDSKNNIIKGNKTNKLIASRNGANAILEDNIEDLNSFDFLQALATFQDAMGIEDLYKPINKE